MSKHTPGPWTIGGSRDWSGWVVGPESTPPVATIGQGVEEWRANGKLIAAAPELLEAVQRALAVEASVTQGQERELRAGYLDLLRAAIAKAEGAEP